MFTGSADKKNFAMWYRMLISRVCVMAGALSLTSMRLKRI